VEAVEHDEQDAHARRVADQTLVGEGVGLELAVLEGTDRVLGLLRVAVERRKVEVRRRLVLVGVLEVGPEEVYE
jgi:hypothetical protein